MDMQLGKEMHNTHCRLLTMQHKTTDSRPKQVMLQLATSGGHTDTLSYHPDQRQNAHLYSDNANPCDQHHSSRQHHSSSL
jgi:hypothetical protein